MIGRGAIRSPWLFNQIRQRLRGEPVTLPTGRDVWAYIRALWDSQACFDKPERVQCERMKKFLGYLGEGVPAPFLHQIRRSQTAAEFHRICAEFLDHERPMALEPDGQDSNVSSSTPSADPILRAAPDTHRPAGPRPPGDLRPIAGVRHATTLG